MKIADCHMHSFFSSDSEAPTEEMVKRAVELGLPAICLTDHYDMDYSTGEFQLDTPAYAAKIRELQEKYHDRIDIRFGVELGLQLHLKERMEEYVNAWPFDYVIGSMHVIDGKDPYYEDAFPDWTAEELYRAYFRATAENIRFFHNFQTLGHLDYVVRYCREKGKDYSYRAFADEIDTILKELIQYDIALEINTGGYKAGLGVPNPTPDVIKRYRELGGEKMDSGTTCGLKRRSRNICRSNRKRAGKAGKKPRKGWMPAFPAIDGSFEILQKYGSASGLFTNFRNNFVFS